MSRHLPPVAMAPGYTRALAAHPRIHTARRRALHVESPHPDDLGLGPLFVHTRDALIVGNVETGRIVLWNPAAERLFGYSAREAIGQPIDMLIPPPFARLHHEALAHYRRTGEGTILGSEAPMEVPARAKSGAELRVELSLVALEASTAGRRQYVLAMLRDVSDRKRAELHSLEAARAEAARSEATRLLSEQSRLLTGSLDELARPLDKLQRSTARLARSAAQPDARRVELLACVVGKRVEALRRGVRQLADASAIKHGTLGLATQRTNLVPLVSRVVSSARARASGYRFNIALPQGLTALVDPQRLEQVVDTLLEQAMRRNPRGCWIDVDLRRPLVGLAQLEVRDYGRAVSAEERAALLDAHGLGSGLAVSRWLVEQHGGTLSLESPDEGGLRVTVMLPTQRGRVSGS